MPMPMPPMKDNGKETRPPNREAPTALTIMKAKVPTLTTVKGAPSTPARPDTAPASAQLNRATLTGRTPISSAVGASWPAPRRPRPNQVRRRITARAVTRISEMTKMAARCRSTTTSRMLNPPTGNSRCLSGMARAWGPLSWSITPEAKPRTGRADELAGGAGVHQRSDDEPFRQEGHGGGDADGHEGGDKGREDGRLGAEADPASLGADEARVRVGADEGEAAVGEGQHPGGPEHERHGDRDQPVDGADHDPGGGQVQQFPHDAALRRMFIPSLRGSVVHPPAEAPPGGRHRDRRPGARPVDGR